MSTENKKSEKNFAFNSFKEDKSTKRKSLALDILFGLLLIAMCVLLMSLSASESKLVKLNSDAGTETAYKNAFESDLFSHHGTTYEQSFKNHISIKKNQAIVN